jgi:two-component system nitrogen regulation response regulator GlnG
VEKPVVLLADDNEPTRTLISALLRKHYTVEIATDGNEAIQRLRTKDYAAVLLDLLMPRADGYAVLDFISAERNELLPRVVVMTASVAPREIARVRTYAVSGVVAKPFDIEELLTAVRVCTGQATEPFSGTLLSSGMLMLFAEILRRV